MKRKNLILVPCTLALLIGTLYSATSSAHGYLDTPPSRQIQYYNGGWQINAVEGPKLPPGGVMTGDDASENSVEFPAQAFANGNSDQNNIGAFALSNEQYKWNHTPMKPGVQNFVWKFSAPHRTTYFTYFITKQDWKSKPGYGQKLTREMFEDKPFCHHIWGSNLDRPDGTVVHACNIPQRSGEQKIYAIWRVRDTSNAFYSMADVKFDGDNTPGGDNGGEVEQHKPVIGLANAHLIVNQSTSSAAYTLDASATQHATRYKWEVIGGNSSSFMLQKASEGSLAFSLEGDDIKTARAWIAANYSGIGKYRLTATNQYGSDSKEITVEVKAQEVQQKPIITVAKEKIVVNQSAANEGYTLDASGTQNATHYSWEVIQGFSNFQLQEKAQMATSQKLAGPALSAPRAWVAANHTGTGVYRLTASNKYGSVSKDITVEVKANQPGGDTGGIEAYRTDEPYKVACTKVSFNGQIWQNQWWANAGQETPGTGGAWGIWRLTGSSDNSCK